MRKTGMVTRPAIKDHVAAISCGIWKGTPVLDLDYAEDSTADTDANFVLTGSGGLVEIQGTAEGAPFRRRPVCGPPCSGTQGDRRACRLARKSSRMKLARGARLVIASHNPGKVFEIEALLQPLASISSARAHFASSNQKKRAQPLPKMRC